MGIWAGGLSEIRTGAKAGKWGILAGVQDSGWELSVVIRAAGHSGGFAVCHSGRWAFWRFSIQADGHSGIQ